MDPFAETIQGWHDFYLMIGAAAATLIGLLFVALSLNADAINRKANVDLRLLAAQTFSSFILVLMFAVLFLIPLQGPEGLGVPLLGIGAFALWSSGRRFFAARRQPVPGWELGSLARRFAIPMLCYAVLLVIAISVLLGQTSGLYWLVAVMIILIWIASLNAWDLLLRLREPAPES